MSANTAPERLALALDAAAGRGEPWPCKDSDDWTADDPDTRAAAARACLACPVTALCSAAADELGVQFGTWAGTDRTPRPRRREGAA